MAATAKLNKRILEMAGRLNVSLPVGATILPDVPDAPLWAAKLAQSSWSSVFHGELRNDTSQSTNAVLHPLLDDSQNPFWLALQLCIFGSSYNSHREGATWGSNDDLQCQPKNDGGKLESNREQKQCNKSYDSTPLLVIMESFGAWLNIRKTHPSYDKWLSEDVKLSAFLEMFSKSDVRLFNIVFDLYQLDTCKSEAILPFIRQAVADKRYGHACQAVSAFGLQDRFEVTDILFPLIVLNKRKLVKRYLEKGHHLSEIRLKLLRFLDGVCRENLRTKSNSVVPELIRYLEIPDVDQQHSSIQHIYRFALKLAKKYQLPDDECKNVFAVQRFAVLRFLIFKNYHEKSIHQEDWVDLISSFVGKRLELQLKALESMVRQNDVVTARHLSINWGVNSKKLPTDVSKALITGQFTPRRRTNIRDNQLHDSLSGSTNDQTYSPDVLKTHFVDSPSEFGTFIDSVQVSLVFKITYRANIDIEDLKSKHCVTIPVIYWFDPRRLVVCHTGLRYNE